LPYSGSSLGDDVEVVPVRQLVAEAAVGLSELHPDAGLAVRLQVVQVHRAQRVLTAHALVDDPLERVDDVVAVSGLPSWNVTRAQLDDPVGGVAVVRLNALSSASTYSGWALWSSW
jgi:hypothetical protein